MHKNVYAHKKRHFIVEQCAEVDYMASVNVVAAVAVASLTFNGKGMLETRFSCLEGFRICEEDTSLILFPG